VAQYGHDAALGFRDRNVHLDAARDRGAGALNGRRYFAGVALVILSFLGVVMTALFTALS
jgi:hypothetical protein